MRRSGSRTVRGRVGGLLLVVALGAVACQSDDDASAMHAEVVDAYRNAYNAGDIEGVMALFTEESMLVDHPTALFGTVGDGGTTLTGLSEIRQANEVDRATAADANAYEFVDVEVRGDTVTWDHAWEGLNGAEWCGAGHSAVIVDGKFVSWQYAADPRPCSPDCSFDEAFGDDPPDACRR